VWSRFKRWQLALLAVVLCAAAVGLGVGLVQWRHSTRPYTAADLIACLPPDPATHVFIDVELLRRAGLLDLLAGSKASEEPDYRHFVEQTGFDYRTDLGAIAAAFSHGNVYFALRARYDWKRLSAYATSQGGECRGDICSMPGSRPERRISFYPLKRDVLALAVSPEDRGVLLVGPNQWKTVPVLPPDPVWVSAPAFEFADLKNFPEGTHAFFSPLAQAQQVIFAAGQQGQRLQIRLEATYASPDAAASFAKQLKGTTDLLNRMLAREHMKSNPKDLSGVLTAGTFEQQGDRVVGTWPIERTFVESLASGKGQ